MTNKKIPKIKKDITDFLKKEEGKMSKESVVELGINVAVLSPFFNHEFFC